MRAPPWDAVFEVETSVFVVQPTRLWSCSQSFLRTCPASISLRHISGIQTYIYNSLFCSISISSSRISIVNSVARPSLQCARSSLQCARPSLQCAWRDNWCTQRICWLNNLGARDSTPLPVINKSTKILLKSDNWSVEIEKTWCASTGVDNTPR